MKGYVKLILKNDNFYDCFIYKKNLYFVTFDCKIIPFAWVDFISDISPKDNNFAFIIAFTRGDLIYSDQFRILREETSFFDYVKYSFDSLADKVEIFNFDSLIFKYTTKQQWWRSIESLPADFKCRSNKLFLALDDGLYSCDIHSCSIANGKRNVISAPYIIANGKYVDFDFVGNDIFLAGLNDGLFELPIDENNFFYDDLKKLSDLHTSYVSNNFSSFLRGSYIGKSSLIKTEKKDEEIREVSSVTNFEDDAFYFSLYDKTYRILNGRLEVCNYQNKEKYTKQFIEIKELNFIQSKNDIVCAKVSLFGIIIELRDQLIIIPSNENLEPITFGSGKDPIINWKIYPDSIDYKNHLHLIYKDRIEIISFYFDFFCNQSSKRIGAKYFKNK